MSEAVAAESPWAAGLKAARDNLVPSLFILAAAAGLVVCYYQVPSVKVWLDVVGKVNAEHPTLFAMLCTGVTAGFIPWCFRMAFPSLRPVSKDPPCFCPGLHQITLLRSIARSSKQCFPRRVLPKSSVRAIGYTRKNRANSRLRCARF